MTETPSNKLASVPKIVARILLLAFVMPALLYIVSHAEKRIAQPFSDVPVKGIISPPPAEGAGVHDLTKAAFSGFLYQKLPAILELDGQIRIHETVGATTEGRFTGHASGRILHIRTAVYSVSFSLFAFYIMCLALRARRAAHASIRYLDPFQTDVPFHACPSQPIGGSRVMPDWRALVIPLSLGLSLDITVSLISLQITEYLPHDLIGMQATPAIEVGPMLCATLTVLLAFLLSKFSATTRSTPWLGALLAHIGYYYFLTFPLFFVIDSFRYDLFRSFGFAFRQWTMLGGIGYANLLLVALFTRFANTHKRSLGANPETKLADTRALWETWIEFGKSLGILLLLAVSALAILVSHIVAQFQVSPSRFKLATDIGDHALWLCVSIASLRWIYLELRTRSEYLWPTGLLLGVLRRNLRLFVATAAVVIGMGAVTLVGYFYLNRVTFQLTDWYDLAFDLNITYIAVKLYGGAVLLFLAAVYFLLVPYLYVKGLRSVTILGVVFLLNWAVDELKTLAADTVGRQVLSNYCVRSLVLMVCAYALLRVLEKWVERSHGAAADRAGTVQIREPLSVQAACEKFGLSRRRLYELCRTEMIVCWKRGGRWVVNEQSLRRAIELTSKGAFGRLRVFQQGAVDKNREVEV